MTGISQGNQKTRKTINHLTVFLVLQKFTYMMGLYICSRKLSGPGDLWPEVWKLGFASGGWRSRDFWQALGEPFGWPFKI